MKFSQRRRQIKQNIRTDRQAQAQTRIWEKLKEKKRKYNELNKPERKIYEYMSFPFNSSSGPYCVSSFKNRTLVFSLSSSFLDPFFQAFFSSCLIFFVYVFFFFYREFGSAVEMKRRILLNIHYSVEWQANLIILIKKMSFFIENYYRLVDDLFIYLFI